MTMTSTDHTGWQPSRETTAAVSNVTVTSHTRDVYTRVREILTYDVRTIDAPDQAWFWTEAWQTRENEADASFAAGRSATFANVDDFLTDLDDD